MAIQSRPSWHSRRGFTVVELMVGLILAGVVLTAISQVLVGEKLLYLKQRGQEDVRHTLRAAGSMLAFEFRQAAQADLYEINETSVVLRSSRGGGVICGQDPTRPRYHLWKTFGELAESAEDSALVYSSGDARWLGVDIRSIGPTGDSTTVCDWGPAQQPADLLLEVDTAGAEFGGVAVGAPVRVFRRVAYRLLQWEGRWWLGRKVGGSKSFSVLAGPLQKEGGLRFTYYGADGLPTIDRDEVRYVDIHLRGESLNNVPGGSDGKPRYQQDEVVVRAALRN